MTDWTALKIAVDGIEKVVDSMSEERYDELKELLEDCWHSLNHDALLKRLEQSRGYVKLAEENLAKHKTAEKVLEDALAPYEQGVL